MSKLRFDGYYYYLKKNIIKNDSYNYILRFFEKNNKVIGVTVSPQKDDIIVGFGDFFPSGNWFNENYENNGNFDISGDQISFKCGEVLYNGTIINQDKLKLFSHSNLNGHEETKEYKFISFDALNDIKTSEN